MENSIFDHAMGHNRRTIEDELIEYEMKYISLEDCISLAKQKLFQDLDKLSTEKLLQQHAMVFNR